MASANSTLDTRPVIGRRVVRWRNYDEQRGDPGLRCIKSEPQRKGRGGDRSHDEKDDLNRVRSPLSASEQHGRHKEVCHHGPGHKLV
jgi:hypothetical protein